MPYEANLRIKYEQPFLSTWDGSVRTKTKISYSHTTKSEYNRHIKPALELLKSHADAYMKMINMVI